MIEGIVQDRHFASVPVEVVGEDGRRVKITTLVDTGFTGELTLDGETIRQLGLRLTGTRTGELADGQLVRFTLYAARVVWHDAVRRVAVMHADAEALIGMSLLEGCRLTIDVIDGGAVAVQPLTPASG